MGDNRSDGRESPYREFALLYDELVGKAAFDCWRENFEVLSRRFNFEFRSVADIACGTGLAVSYLAERCDIVYAVDGSSHMLDIARSRVGTGNVVFLIQSFVDLHLPEKVDLLTCNFDSLNYVLDESDLAETLTRFCVSLKSGGWAVFDMNTDVELGIEGSPEVSVLRCAEGFSVWESSWDEETRIHTVRMSNFLKGKHGKRVFRRETHRERAYDLEFLLPMIKRAGFDRVQVFDARDLCGVTGASRRFQFVASKD